MAGRLFVDAIYPNTTGSGIYLAATVRPVVNSAVGVLLSTTGYYYAFNNASPFNVLLPSGSGAGIEFILKNKGAGTATIIPSGTQLLFSTGQVPTYSLLGTGNSCKLIYGGTGEWDVLFK